MGKKQRKKGKKKKKGQENSPQKTSESFKEREEPAFLFQLLQVLVYAFVLLALILRFFVSGVRAELAAPVGGTFLGLSYGQERSLHFFVLALLTFAVALYLLHFILEGRFRVWRTSFDLPFIAFLGWCWLSLFWTSHLQTSLHVVLTWTTYLFFFYLLFHLFDAGGKEKILIPLLAIGFSLAIMAMLEVWMVYPMAEKELKNEFKRAKKTYFLKMFQSRVNAKEATGPFITSNIYGSFLSMIFLLGLGFLGELLDRRKKSYLQLALLFLALLSIALALYLTHSKGAWMACIFGMFLFILFWQRKRIFQTRKSMFIFLGAVLLIILIGMSVIYGLGKGADFEKSLSTRQIYNQALFRMIVHHPFFGVSIGNFFAFYPAYKSPSAVEIIRHAHNDYLQILAEIGIFGFLLYLWFWWGIWKKWLYYFRLEPVGSSSLPSKRKENKENAHQADLLPSWLSSLGILFVTTLAFLLIYKFQNTILGDGEIWSYVFLAFSVFFLLFYLGEAKSQHIYSHSPYPYYFVMLGAASGVGAFLFHGLGSYVLYSPSILFLVLLLVAFITGYGKSLVEEKKKKPYLLDWNLGLGRQLLLFLLIFFWIGLLVAGLQTSIRADQWIYRGDEAKKKAFSAKKQKEKVKILKKAINSYLQASYLSPLDEKICLALAKTAELAYSLSGNQKFIKIAKKEFEKALYLGPRNYLVDYHYSQFYETHPGLDPDYNERERLMKKCVTLFPTQAKYHYLLANIYLEKAKKEGGAYFLKAEKEFRKALELNLMVPPIYGIVDSEGHPNQEMIETGLKKLYELRKQ